MAENITLTDGVTTVTVEAAVMEKIFDNKLTSFTPPKSTARQTDNPADPQFGPNLSKIYNLLRIDTTYSIDGYISQRTVVGDTSTNVQDRKDDLENIYQSGNNITFNYDNESGITGTINRLSITKDDFDNRPNNTGESGYRVKFSIIKGEKL